ncbi:hypothetical protein EGI26_04500 [Lacihabitans sp. CCS-44]|uniref:hypothetical protein n=1 Tax=Lacihabitans sp. CCS-44 TaxID=2487331 RepID=UPI0020CC5208|nr:hypothetical protein [Lacihabitans sp. CCS-44]MCP9754421.1 hypothetical protein [Lacihabitans sp. CCS-44]
MTLAYIIAAVVVLHFVIGIAYLIYKINTAKPNEDLKNNKQPGSSLFFHPFRTHFKKLMFIIYR